MDQVRPAAVAAAGVFAFLVARALVYGIGTTIYWVTSGVPSAGVGSYPEAVAWSWQESFVGLLDTALPLSIGTFLVFWCLRPIRHDLRVAQVIRRGALAVAVGAVLASLVQAALDFGTLSLPVVESGGLYGLTPVVPSPVDLVLGTMNLVVVYLPLVVLAAVLLWIWLRRSRPTASVGGAGDEV
jgi:hypothetical protein